MIPISIQRRVGGRAREGRRVHVRGHGEGRVERRRVDGDNGTWLVQVLIILLLVVVSGASLSDPEGQQKVAYGEAMNTG